MAGRRNTILKVQLVGMMEVRFSDNRGQEINGKSIFTAFQDENVEGLRTEKFFVKAGISLPKDIKINDMIDISFNHKGKIEMIQKA